MRTSYPDMDALRNAFNERTKVVLINSPNNPTGVLYSSELLAEMCEAISEAESEARARDLSCQRRAISQAALRRSWNTRTSSIITNAASSPRPTPRILALPGERIGYIAVHPDYEDKAELMDGLVFCNRTLGFVNAPALMQHIVRVLQSATVDIAEYQRKRDFLYDSLTEMGYSLVKPQGAFYMFPASPNPDDVDFVAELQEHKVLVVPGRGFGQPGYFRISYCLDDATLEGSLPGFEAAIRPYR